MLRDLALKNGTKSELVELGQAANVFASRAVFDDYKSRKAQHTLARQEHELSLLADFVRSTGVMPGDFFEGPAAWAGCSWGLVASFQKHLLNQGYSVSTVNITVSTVKVYAKLAFKSGTLDGKEYALIHSVEGYSRKEAVHLDAKREQVRRSVGTDGRATTKKSEAVKLSTEQAATLKAQDHPRDRLLMALLLDHGLRISEVAALKAGDFDLRSGTLRFYRPKVGSIGVHKLSGDTLRAALEYIVSGVLADDSLLFGVSIRGLSKRVGAIGRAVGIEHLSPHDCRHYAASDLAGRKTMRELMDLMGWTSPAMAVRYIASGAVLEVD